jgi:glycosyltransferase involved in cell wall biosynthesis
MRIAMLGTRGMPAHSGGIERVIDALSRSLAGRGHDVTVFCRTNYVTSRAPSVDGVHLRYLPTIGTKHLDTFAHTTLATGAAARGFDVLHYHALGPGLLAPIARVLSPRSAIVQTVHGLDYQRDKWARCAQQVLRIGEWVSARVPDEVIVVSQSLADHYRSRYGVETTVVPHIFPKLTPRPARLMKAMYGLTAGTYILFVGRLVPEKRPDMLLRVFHRMQGGQRLVIVGGPSYTDQFVERVHRLAALDSRVVLTGPVNGALLEELYTNASAFVTPSIVEGNPLTLLEALRAGIPVVATQIGPHLETLGGDGPGHRVFPPDDEYALKRAIERVLDDGALGRLEVERIGRALQTAQSALSVVVATEAVYQRALAARGRRVDPNVQGG